MFGWGDSHFRVHRAEVFPNVALYDGGSETLVGPSSSLAVAGTTSHNDREF